MVEFGPVAEPNVLTSEYDNVHVTDIIGFDDAFRHPLLPGDRCLVPQEKHEWGRYEPATVMEGSEQRAGKGEMCLSLSVLCFHFFVFGLNI